MRKLIIIFVFFSLKLWAANDSLIVESFNADVGDLSARRYEKTDVNGQICAIIKVRSDLTGMKFNARLGITGNIDYKEGEYWLFVSPSEKKLTILKDGYSELNYLITEIIESNVVYVMSITDKAKPKICVLSVNTTPTSDFIIDGKPKGISPQLIKDLSPGSHLITIKKAGFLTVTKTFELKLGEKVTIDETLLDMQAVTFNTNPQGAELYINDEYKGKTPKSVSIKLGENKIKFSLSGYLAQSETFINVEGNLFFNYDLTLPTIKDNRDGKTYKIISIGKQFWMAENLNYVTNSGSICYEAKSSNCDKYGRLYNWETAKTACPNGWHLPNKTEWEILFNNFGGGKAAKKELIEGGSSLFNLIPYSGNCSYSDGSHYYSAGWHCDPQEDKFWSSSLKNHENRDWVISFRTFLGSEIEETSWTLPNYTNSYSVRCIKN